MTAKENQNQLENEESSLSYSEFLKIIKPDEDNQKPSFFTIMPASVRYVKNITDFQKIIFSEIIALSHTNYDKEGRYFCHAGNSYFARVYEKDKVRISEAISNLKKQGFIFCKYIYEYKEYASGKKTKECKARLIYPNPLYFTQTSRNTCNTEIVNTCNTEIVNTCNTEIVKENNININNINREVVGAPLSETKKSTYENINSEYNEFERYIVSHYVELTGKPIMDIRQIPEFKTEQGRQVLRTAFDNRKNDWGIAIDNALDSTSKSNREFRWLDFMKSLYLNLSFVNEEKEPPKTEKQLKREKLYEALKNRFGEVWEERYENAWKPNGMPIDQEFSDFYTEVSIALGLY